MAASTIGIPKTRLDLAVILQRNGFDFRKSIVEVTKIVDIDDDKMDSFNSLMAKIHRNIQSSKKSDENYSSEWWKYEIPWQYKF